MPEGVCRRGVRMCCCCCYRHRAHGAVLCHAERCLLLKRVATQATKQWPAPRSSMGTCSALALGVALRPLLLLLLPMYIACDPSGPQMQPTGAWHKCGAGAGLCVEVDRACQGLAVGWRCHHMLAHAALSHSWQRAGRQPAACCRGWLTEQGPAACHPASDMLAAGGWVGGRA